MSTLLASYAHARPRGAKVLVAEDHADTRCLLRTLLEKRGLTVVEAGDGVEAVAAAERERPDLILMDGGLPLLDGCAATRRLRGLPALSAVPIVFLSGHAGNDYRAAALDAGCDDYVVKPFEIARLDTVLDQHIPGLGGDGKKGSNQRMAQGLGTNIRREAAELSVQAPATPKLFGLIELDSAGTVLYTRTEPDGDSPVSAPDYTGLNFYTEVAPFRNVVEFRHRLEDFSRGSHPAYTIDFICDYEDGPLAVRVLLARIRERSQADETKSILIHIRRVR